VLLVSLKGSKTFCKAFGCASLHPERTMKEDTFFDLASLTKPLATVVSYMVLTQGFAIDLDDALGRLLPDFNKTNKKNVTVRQLLSHSSGLPAYRPYFETLRDLPQEARKEALRNNLIREPLVNMPGSACLYSDLGFMILQMIVERITGTQLDHFVKSAVYEPLGISDLFFNRLDNDQNKSPYSYAVTEKCPWRGEFMEGKVHDDHAYLMGGVAGHAGLFGTVEAVHALLQRLLTAWKGDADTMAFETPWIRTFFQPQSRAGTWALGFDTPSRPESSSGKYFSDRSVGHLGFTGTSFWMDLEKEVIIVLLSNRIHPTRANEKIKRFRPLIHDTVMTALGYGNREE
jgi:CubicO group peptidase (beta-lactamase class C family)